MPLSESPLAPPASAQSLAWLEGTWVAEGFAGEAQGERWQRNAEGVLVGRGFTRRPLMQHTLDENPHAVEQTSETMEIVQRVGGHVYIASPVGQTRTEFPITTLEANHFVAENPSHDFPTRIEYTLQGETLTARVSSSKRAFSLVFARREQAR